MKIKANQAIHLDGWPLHFWPKWVINITKWSMQIYSFWQNSRPQRPKRALFWVIIEIERALFVSFYSISTQDKATFGQSEIRKKCFCTHCYIATLERNAFEAGQPAKWLFEFTAFFHLEGRHLQLTAISQLSKGRLLKRRPIKCGSCAHALHYNTQRMTFVNFWLVIS